LKRILGVVVVAEDTATDAPHRRSMPPHKGRKSRFVTTADVVLQQLPIGRPCSIPQKHRPAKVLDNPAQFCGRHVPSFWVASVAPPPYYYPHLLSLIHVFSSTGRLQRFPYHRLVSSNKSSSPSIQSR
jgi:hypothetical protein